MVYVASFYPVGFHVALGEPGGGFGTPASYAGPFGTIVAGDSNADGFDDLFLFGGTLSPPCLEVWLGHADGTLTLDEDVTRDGCMQPNVDVAAAGHVLGGGWTGLSRR